MKSTLAQSIVSQFTTLIGKLVPITRTTPNSFTKRYSIIGLTSKKLFSSAISSLVHLYRQA